ncbi:MAG: ATP-binding cassette domain-containing protein [Ferrimicrobium sp.]|uniref:ATP-binding cassette domain-containing protein n=1 Tax=Ferrimicrobium acidiphilum TaxID=121039 RepID=A0ABV3XZT5_9ACTN|nr:ATP-binding cassette domain-containing protein [Ferrimicrobium sp.]
MSVADRDPQTQEALTRTETARGQVSRSKGAMPLLSVEHLVKNFGPVRAVNDVSLDLFEGEVVGLVGDNGAGKSTLLSILTGYHHADSGVFRYRGEVVAHTSPSSSRRALKIEMIYQHLDLAPDLPVWQNLFLAEERRKFKIFLDKRWMRQRAAEVLGELGSKVKPDDLVGALSGGEQQVVAISRALLFERDIVLMDEPTAAISLNKVRDVLDLIMRLRGLGKTVVLVSHRLEDILEVADRIVILRRGTIAQILHNDHQMSVSELARMMFEDVVHSGVGISDGESVAEENR